MHLTGINTNLPITNFTIVGMAGILSGLFHAPLTGIFLIGEITGGYDLMVPLMIVSSISYAVSRQFEKHSMDVKSLADKGDVFTSDKDKNILQSIDLLKLVRTDVLSITLDKSLENVVEHLSNSKQNLIPVVDDKQKLLGVVDFEEIRSLVFNPYRIKFTTVEEVLTQPKEIINHDDGLELIMEKFESTNEFILPVIKSGKLFGLLYKMSVLEAYREQLKDMIIE